MRNGSSLRCRSWVSTRVSFTPAPSEVAWPATTRSTLRARVTLSSAVVVIACSPVCARRSGRDDFVDLLEGRGDAFLQRLLAHVEAFRVHEMHVRHAEEVEHGREIGYLRIGGRVA